MTSLPEHPCYLNGHWLPLARASVSVLDRGFIFGDGIYEAVPVYGGRLFRFDEHMARLERSLHHTRIANPQTREQWLALVDKVLKGGDVLNINEKTLAVGISQRTQAAAIDVMAQNIFWNSDSKVERSLSESWPVLNAHTSSLLYQSAGSA